MPSKLDRRTFLATTLTSGALLAAGESVAAPDPMSKEAVLHDPEAPILGNPKGSVTLVEYFDYQCPYCKKSYPQIMDLVRRDGDIRFVMKDWPIFGAASLYAAHLTLAAGKHRPQALDALIRTDGRLSPQSIDDTLAKAGFDVAALKQNYRRDKAKIDGLLRRNDTQAGGFGFNGTPAFVAGTVIFPGVPRMEDLKSALDRGRAG
ncbi:DsbA family protein [Jiella avicenniae]|uniref:DsbA family protein n=1 Tax=Jiella avicenniae TaxID=2907202 RepID=A0A9X1TDJ0_9HYPH|nr:DsbA family protein [Jiella avicenniae]MCE7030178.1 DsbA family protein [Jiella avicenniae]